MSGLNPVPAVTVTISEVLSHQAIEGETMRRLWLGEVITRTGVMIGVMGRDRHHRGIIMVRISL